MKSTLKFSLISFFGTSLIAASAQVKSDINAPLTDAHWRFIEQNAPIIVQPDCDPTEQWCVRIDHDDQDPTNNEAASKTLNEKTPAAIDIDWNETGSVIEIVYQLNRPSSTNSGFDMEAVTLWFKKDSVGSSFEKDITSFNPELAVVRTAAHGGMLSLAGSTKYVSTIGPDFGPTFIGMTRFTSELTDVAAAQSAGNGRVVDLSLGRVFALSDKRNALVPASSVANLASAYDAEGTVIFVPAAFEGESRDAIQKVFKNVKKIVPYDLRGEFLARVLKDKKNWMANENLISNFDRSTIDGRGVQVAIADVGTEIRKNSAGKASGANPWFGWPMIEIANINGESLNLKPAHYKKNLGRGYYHFDMENVVMVNFIKLVSNEEKETGGNKLVRSLAFKYTETK